MKNCLKSLHTLCVLVLIAVLGVGCMAAGSKSVTVNADGTSTYSNNRKYLTLFGDTNDPQNLPGSSGGYRGVTGAQVPPVIVNQHYHHQGGDTINIESGGDRIQIGDGSGDVKIDSSEPKVEVKPQPQSRVVPNQTSPRQSMDWRTPGQQQGVTVHQHIYPTTEVIQERAPQPQSYYVAPSAPSYYYNTTPSYYYTPQYYGGGSYKAPKARQQTPSYYYSTPQYGGNVCNPPAGSAPTQSYKQIKKRNK